MKVDLEWESTIISSWHMITTCKQKTEELVKEKKIPPLYRGMMVIQAEQPLYSLVVSDLLHVFIFNITIHIDDIWRQVAPRCLWWELFQTLAKMWLVVCPETCSVIHLSLYLQITMFPAVPFCLIAAWARTIGHSVICPLQVCPHPRGELPCQGSTWHPENPC